ncbi:hypothetical protein HOY82DRAFT_544390, partial [Tuber indicum]
MSPIVLDLSPCQTHSSDFSRQGCQGYKGFIDPSPLRFLEGSNSKCLLAASPPVFETRILQRSFAKLLHSPIETALFTASYRKEACFEQVWIPGTAMSRASKQREKDSVRRKQNRERRKERKAEQRRQLHCAVPDNQDEEEHVENFRAAAATARYQPASSEFGKMLYQMRRNTTNILTKPNANVVYHKCSNFDVVDAIHFQPKRQPKSNSKENFELENEPQLQRITGNMIILND